MIRCANNLHQVLRFFQASEFGVLGPSGCTKVPGVLNLTRLAFLYICIILKRKLVGRFTNLLVFVRYSLMIGVHSTRCT